MDSAVVCFLLTGFSLLLIMSVFIGYYSRDMAGQIICSGIVGMMFAHVFENIGMCVLLMPVTGIPLPFISYLHPSVYPNTLN